MLPKNTATAQHPDSIAARCRAVAGLLALALLNIGCFATRAQWTALHYADWLDLPLAIQAAENSYWTGQHFCFGVAAALIPARRYVGLAAASILALASGAIHAWCLVMIHESRAGVPLDVNHIFIQFAATADIVLATFVVVQGLRFVCGWRIGLDSQAGQTQTGQFRLGDLIEWTAAVAAWLAVLRLHRLAWSSPAEYLIYRLSLIALVLPVALVATGQGRRRLKSVAGLLVWIVVVEAAGNFTGYLTNPSAFAFQWRLLLAVTIGSTAGIVLAAAVNFTVLRWLGFRWIRSRPFLENS